MVHRYNKRGINILICLHEHSIIFRNQKQAKKRGEIRDMHWTSFINLRKKGSSSFTRKIPARTTRMQEVNTCLRLLVYQT